MGIKSKKYYVYTKFGVNRTKIDTFIRFIKLFRKVIPPLWDPHSLLKVFFNKLKLDETIADSNAYPNYSS